MESVWQYFKDSFSSPGWVITMVVMVVFWGGLLWAVTGVFWAGLVMGVIMFLIMLLFGGGADLDFHGADR